MRMKPTVGSSSSLIRLSRRPKGTNNRVQPRARGRAEKKYHRKGEVYWGEGVKENWAMGDDI